MTFMLQVAKGVSTVVTRLSSLFVCIFSALTAASSVVGSSATSKINRNLIVKLLMGFAPKLFKL